MVASLVDFLPLPTHYKKGVLIMPSFLIMDGNGNKKEFDLSQIKSKNDVAQAFKEFNQEVKEKKNQEEK